MERHDLRVDAVETLQPDLGEAFVELTGDGPDPPTETDGSSGTDVSLPRADGGADEWRLSTPGPVVTTTCCGRSSTATGGVGAVPG